MDAALRMALTYPENETLREGVGQGGSALSVDVEGFFFLFIETVCKCVCVSVYVGGVCLHIHASYDQVKVS